MKKRIIGSVAAGLWTLSHTALALGPKLAVSDNTWVQVGALLQTTFARTENYGTPAVTEDKFFLRRARLILNGSVSKDVQFFISTDNSNGGYPGTPVSNSSAKGDTFFLNDAFVEYVISPEVKIDSGRLLVPFSFDNLETAGALLGLDENTNANRMPSYIVAPLRDQGVEARGLLAGHLVDYRVAVLNGDPVSHTDMRVAGHVMLNFADAQPGFFYSNNTLGQQTIRSLGFGFDRQKNGGWNSTTAAPTDLSDVVFEGIFEQPMGNHQSLAGSVAYYHWKNAVPAAGDEGGVFNGNTGYVQAGYLINDWQPVVRIEHVAPDVGTHFNPIHVGVNYYIDGQSANLKAEYVENDSVDATGKKYNAFRVQAQLLF